MQQLKNWKAYRSGGAITINGVEVDTGRPRRVSGIESIEMEEGRVVATHGDGEKFELTLD